MRDADYPQFAELLDQTCTILSKGAHKPNAQSAAMWFRVLAQYDVETVRAAFDGHVRDPDRGRFVPVPADIIAKIHAADGRPTADEAWAIAVKASDEQATVTWTDDIAEAWGIARPIWAIGDDIGARMAFRHAYDRITADAKRNAKPAKWWPSLGHDQATREPEVKRAVAVGLLEHESALMLQAPDSGTLQRLASQAPPEVRETLLALRDRLTAQTPADERYVPSQDAIDKRHTEELKRETQEKVDAYMKARL